MHAHTHEHTHTSIYSTDHLDYLSEMTADKKNPQNTKYKKKQKQINTE